MTTGRGGQPNPGSPEAIKRGCVCPVLDNRHGRTPPFPPDGWWRDVACPLHGIPSSSGKTLQRTTPPPTP